MIDIQNTKQRRKWETLPRDKDQRRWSTLYAAMYKDGMISLSRATHEALGGPAAYLILYDRETNVVGLRPANRAVEKDAYPVFAKGKYGGQRIFASRLIREYGIYLSDETVRFPRVIIDHDGTLILDLKDVKPAMKKRKSKYGN